MKTLGPRCTTPPADSPLPGVGLDPARPVTAALTNRQRRDALVFEGDTYAKLYVGKLELAAELAATWGTYHEFPGQLGAASGEAKSGSILKFGGVAEGLYHLHPDRRGVRLGFKAGAASGDRAPGYGALDASASQRGLGDLTINNFQFSPDYHVDLLLFRRMVGQVTDSWFIRPEFSYRFDNDVATRLSALYAQSFFARSTPSGQGPKPKQPMGLEIDGELSYALDAPTDRGQFRAALLGGILFPLAGMDNGDPATTISDSTEFAWTLQGRLYLTF